MAQNLELKAKVNSHEGFKKILFAISAEYKETLIQKDIYYKYDKGLLKLRIQNDSYQLIKYLRKEDELKRWSDYEILKMSSPNAEKFLNDIFTVVVIVEKSRELFIYKNTRIHLDEVKELGKFLELETIVDEKGQQDAEERYAEIFDLLNLSAYEEIRDSYRNLVVNK